MERWAHQIRAKDAILAAFDRGERRVCLQLATGGGKSLIAQDVALEILGRGRSVSLYSNRKIMIDQLSAGLDAAGIFHGVRAAGHEDLREHAFQVCSVQTEASRVLKRQQMQIHAAGEGDLAIWDEAHLHNGEKSVELMRRHYDGGACILGLSATPLGIGQHYDCLIKAATMQELRDCGALVVAHHFGCDEPDLREFKKARAFKGNISEGEDLSESQQKLAIMTPTIMGRVWSWYEQLNPERKPALLFGPGVAESLWFAQQFHAKGVPSAHVDGDDIWTDGRFYRADSKARDGVREGHRAGDIRVVCNRYVLREGVDWPWIEHIILAFVAGNVQTYLQVGGRGLRSSPGKERLVVQDHGGCWWRHGSLNEDREWRLEFTPSIMYGLRANKQRALPIDRKAKQCPQCHQIMNRRVCLCGYEFPPGKASRAVVTMAGELKELSGDVFRPRSISKRKDGPARWERMYYRSRTVKGKRTFNDAMALFARENYWQYPDPSWPFMPIDPIDWFRLVGDVPRERLVQKGVPV